MTRLSIAVAVFIFLAACGREERISFNDQIRPIFNAHCVGCHGGVKQAGGFGLVFRENALRETDSEAFAIVPGKPGRSELLRRLRHPDPELRMPFEAAPLAEADIRLIEQWIDQGAEWEEHWAYLPPERPRVNVPGAPAETDTLDLLVRSLLDRQNLAPAPRAQKNELLRRVAFDLTGLPPRPELAEAFLADELAYPDLVDSLLADPAYGEHLAARWLELARYADSRGFERDRPREIWRYRDWVIRAFNDDLPYNDFITHQLAGDLLPNPTEDQLVATGFHRNTMSNDEGGTENEEFRVAAVFDRVNTTWEALQGTTMACVQCHSHPYDPIRHEEYYTSYAIFNNTADHDHGTDAPRWRTFYRADDKKYRKLQAWVAEHGTANLTQITSVEPEENDERARTQVQSWRMLLRAREPRLRPHRFGDIRGGVFTDRADEDLLYLHPGDSFTLPAQDLSRVAALHLNFRAMDEGTFEVRLDGPDGELVGSLSYPARWALRDMRLPLRPTSGEHRLFLQVAGDGEERVVAINNLGYEPDLPGREEEGYAAVEAFIADLLAAPDSISTPIMVETAADSRRTTHLFERGNWLVPGKEVQPGVPAVLAGEAGIALTDRLTFARWLTAPGQPLTARVAVNRLWAGLFGRGLVTTAEDFGSQGEVPRHRQLLDYLALEFSEPLQWSQKALLRRLVLSETYRQSSAVSPEALATDPHNDLLARGPRKRLTAEQVRDQALAVSGLMSPKMYGPGVMPPQPAGLWEQIPFSQLRWETSEGEDRYRRAIYTFLRRSVVHPGLTTFDASNRESCLSRRINTNTPLQALMTLNDPAFFETAVALARTAATDGAKPKDQIATLYRLLLLRRPQPREVTVLRELYAKALTTPETGVAPELTEGDPELAALAVVANALLNLDEFLTTS